jgi:hypothetical protein
MSRYTQKKIVDEWKKLIPQFTIKDNFVEVKTYKKTVKFPTQDKKTSIVKQRNIGYG